MVEKVVIEPEPLSWLQRSSLGCPRFWRWMAVFAFIAGVPLVFFFGNPQWHRWIFQFQHYVVSPYLLKPMLKHNYEYEYLSTDLSRPPANFTGTWTVWGLNGKKLSEKTYTNGILNGSFCLWDSTGSLIRRGQFVKGRKDGRWEVMGDDGPEDKGDDDDDDDDRIITVGIRSYTAGVPHGEWSHCSGENNDDDDYIVQGQFEKGVRVGVWTLVREFPTPGLGEYSQQTYFFNKMLRIRGEYQNGVADGMWQVLDSRNSPIGEINFWAGRLHGTFRADYSTGKRKIEMHYTAGVVDGELRLWQRDGSLMLVGKYAQGQPDGLWQSWFDDGTKAKRRQYNDGKPTGSWVTWEQEGAIFRQRYYRDGQRVGLWEEPVGTDGGKKYTEYENDQRHGWEIFLDKNGKETARRYFQKGKLMIPPPNTK